MHCSLALLYGEPAEVAFVNRYTPATASLVVGATQQLSGAVQPTDATNKAITWTTSAPSIATVSSTGLVTAVAEGTATITATTADGDFTDTCAVTVTAAP